MARVGKELHGAGGRCACACVCACVPVCVRTIFFGLNVYNMRAHIGEDTRGNTLAGVGERVWMVMVHAVRVHVCVCVAWRARERGSGSAACTRAHKPLGHACARGAVAGVWARFFFLPPHDEGLHGGGACVAPNRWPFFLAGHPAPLFVMAPLPPLFVLSPCARQTHS